MYDDIINYNYKGKKHMSLYERSAQFSSFQALVGYSDDIKESERLTRLPLYYGLKEEEADFVIKKVKEFYHV